MVCNGCGEVMSGDGYRTALHCPSMDASDHEPDASPVHCVEPNPNCWYCLGAGHHKGGPCIEPDCVGPGREAMDKAVELVIKQLVLRHVIAPNEKDNATIAIREGLAHTREFRR